MRWAALGLGAMLVAMLSACTGGEPPRFAPASLEKVSLSLDWKHGVQFLGFYVADAKGYYAEEGLALDIVEAATMQDVDQFPGRVSRGEFDFGLGSGSLVKGMADGLPLVTLANTFQLSPHVFFARVATGIETPGDLKGRSVVVKNKSWERNLGILLAREGLALKDVKTVSGGFDATPFYDGKVDVWAGYLPNEVVRARLRGEKLVTMPLHEYGISQLGGSLYTARSSLASNRAQAVRFLKASVRGWLWATENPSEAVEVMLKRFPEMAADRDFHLASFQATIPLVRPPGVPVGSLDCERWLLTSVFQEFRPDPNSCDDTLIREALAGLR